MTILDFLELILILSTILCTYWRYAATRKTNQLMSESARYQAASVKLKLGEVAPPPSGDVVVEELDEIADRIVGHSEVRTDQTPGQLTIHLPEVASSGHIGCSVFGYSLLVGAVWAVLSTLLPDSSMDFTGSAILAAIMTAAGCGLLFGQSAVCRVDIRDDSVRITRVVGIWLRPTSTIGRGPSPQFRGQSQSPLEMDRYQRAPFYDLTVQRLGLSCRYLLACDTGVGDWLTGLLQQWQAQGRTPVLAQAGGWPKGQLGRFGSV